MKSKLRSNPYIAGPPLSTSEGFFGRRDILDWVLVELTNIHTNALVLFGQRRIGKTTILQQLKHHLPAESFFPVYFNLEDQSQRRLGEVLADLAEEFDSCINLTKHKPENFDNKGKYFRSVFLPDLYKALGDNCRPVFLLDEFDIFDQKGAGQIKNVLAAQSLFPFLKRVMNDDARSAFVFGVGRRTEDVKTINQMFKATLQKEVWVLDPTSAKTLIRQAETNKTLKFTEQAINRIIQLTSNHAYLTQLICQRIWERAYPPTDRNPANTPTIDVDEVNSSIPDTLELGGNALNWLWGGLGPGEQIYASALAEISNEGEPIPETQVINVIAEHAIRLRRREIGLAPQDLVERHILDSTNNHEYLFAIELFRLWVKQKRSLRDVVKEIDQVNPLVQHYFEIGNDFYKKREWDKAVQFFQDALKQDQNHFEANLLLGEAYLSLEQIEDSVHQLDIAFNIDKVETQEAYTQALLALAKNKENENLDQEALIVYDRVLKISPNNRQAQNLQRAIFEKQGEEALQQGNLESALIAFGKAGNTEKANQIRESYQKTTLQALENEADVLVKQMEWKKAIPLLEQLIEKAFDEQNKADLQSKLANCKEEEKLEDLFTLGLGALTRESWEQAQKTFAEIIYIRPTYKKDNKLVVNLLEKAINHIKEEESKPTDFLTNIASIFRKPTEPVTRGTDKTNPGKTPNKRKPQLDAVLIQLSSQRPSDVWRGMEQIRIWLKADLEDKDVYGLLLDAVQKNRDLREQVRNLLTEMKQVGSQTAEQTILSLPSTLTDFMADADDAYYGAEYERAVSLYRQVLILDPENSHAKDHIAKAEIKRITSETASGLPRVAEQYYRRARSYIAARDVITAMNLLNAAIEAAQAKGIKYTEAEEALSNMNNLLLADDFRQKAKTALNENRWNDALESYNKALTLDPTNELTKRELESLQDLLRTETALKKRGIMMGFMPISKLQNTVEAARIVMNSGNPLLSYIEKQLRQIRLFRATSIILLLIIIIFPLYNNDDIRGLFAPVLTNTAANTPNATEKVAATKAEQQEAEPTTPTSTQAIATNTPSPIYTETFYPTATEVILGIGYINKGIASTWDVPNGTLIERLTINHPLTLLEQKVVTNFSWYRCRWESNGITYEGWVLTEYITLGSPPTPRP